MQLLRTFTPQDSTAQRPTHGACSLNKIALMLAVFAIAQWRPGRGLSDDMPLLARVEEQANLFVIPDADAIARFQAELRVELANLEQYLQRGTTAEQQGWKNYLQWDALTANSTGEPDIEFLKTAQLLFRAGHAGLERPAFVGVRDKVDRLLFALSTQSLPDSFRQAFQLRVNQLVNAMREAESDPIFESLHQISTTLNTLESLGFSQELATAVRSQYQLPNLRITADGDFIYNTFAAPVSRTIPVSESLLGTRFRGTAETTGTAKLRLIPSNGTARFELIFDGTTISNARGSQHPVQVGTRAFTSAHAIKLITLDDDGFSSSSSVASCRTTTRVKWIRTLRRRLASRLIERIAYRKAEEQRPLAQRIASRRAEKRVATMMDSQTDEMLGRMNTRFRNRFRPTLEQRSVYPRWVRYTTTEKQFNLHALQCQPNQLGAPTDPPPMPKYAFCVQIHESMPANTAASYMGGINLTEAMAAELAEKLTGEVPADLQKEKDWTVKFDLRKPVVLSFRNNQLKIAMTANRFARGNNSLNRTMEISASYDIIQDGEGFVLRRAPEIDVVFPGKAPDELLGPTELARRNLMQDVFASVFGEEFLTDSIRFPERFEKLQDLRLRYISAENGWLSLGFK